MLVIKENCRLCQKDLGTIPLEESLIKTIFEVTKIEINDNTSNLLPTSVCQNCNNKIIEANLFITEIQNVNKNLKTSLEQNLKDFSNKSTEISDNKLENIVFRDRAKSLVCLICLKSCIRLSSFRKHQKTHPELFCKCCNTLLKTPNGNHNCETILNKKRRKEKDGQNSLNTPTLIKTEIENQFQCIKCEQHFEDEDCYKSHLEIHNGYTCSEENCLKKYTTAYSLKMHKLNHEGRRSFLCVNCGKDFISKKSLICHEKIHAPIKAHKCDSCNVSFSVRSNFRAHIKRYHEGVRYHCSKCPKEFLTKCNLDRHEKIHTGVKEFKCDLCTSAFYTKKELIKHQRYHQGLRQHKCEQCFKTFFERHHLIIHLRSHSGERPYMCEISNCGKSFYDNQKLKRHQKAVHVSK